MVAGQTGFHGLCAVSLVVEDHKLELEVAPLQHQTMVEEIALDRT